MAVYDMLATMFDQWFWLGAGLLALVTGIISIVYMIGSFLMNDKVKAWARMELTELVYSAMILLFASVVIQSHVISNVVEGALGAGGESTSVFIPAKVPGLIPTSDAAGEVLVDLCNTDGTQLDVGTWEGSPYYAVSDCHIRLGIYYLDTIFHETSQYAYDLYMDYIFTSMVSEFTINIEYIFEMPGFFTFTPWKGFFTMENSIKSQCFDYAIKVMMLNQFQEALLRFTAVALFPVLFISGVILRTFTFTRKLGGLLLGIALAMYFVFPSFYAFGALVIIDIKHNPDVIAAWIDPDNMANPGNLPLAQLRGARMSMNPPIANTMYMGRDYIPALGGSGEDGAPSQVSTEEASNFYRMFRGMTPDQILAAMEQGEVDVDGEQVRISPGDTAIDLTPYTEPIDDEERARREERIEQINQNAESWFDTVSSYSQTKSFTRRAFHPGGVIDILSRLTFYSVFFSLISVIGSIATIRSLSATFGGDIEIAGLTRII